MQQPVAGRGDETEGPAPVGAALGVAMVELVAKADPAARKLLGRVERPLARTRRKLITARRPSFSPPAP